MKIYFAPLEGITTYTYRNTHCQMFSGVDTYFAPFIVPTENERISVKTLRDILPENNNVKIIPQVLCSSSDAFCEFAKKVMDLGYDEVNLNLGCPSGTVVKKHRGSGALKDTDELCRFLDGIFSKSEIKISVKTRAGFYSHEEFPKLIGIYNQYPLTELIVHPRVREELYSGTPNMETFNYAYKNSKHRLCYNGDIITIEDYNNIVGSYPDLDSIMIGRGAIKNPAIFRQIKGGERIKTEELIRFSQELEKRHLDVLGCEHYTIHRLKEIWLYMMQNFPEEKKATKAVKKANTLADINAAIKHLPKIGQER